MAKKKVSRKRKQHKTSQKFKIINLILMMLVLTLSITIASYFLIFNNSKNSNTHLNSKQNSEKLDNFVDERLNKYFDQTYNNMPKESLEKNISEENKKIQESIEKTIPRKKDDLFEEYTKEFEKEYIHLEQIKQKKIIEKQPKKQKTIIDNRPKLSIIIDDVTVPSQVRKIQDIGYKITMSFMPPTSRHKNSAKIALNLPFYMIHFPLQAKSFKFEEEKTLHVGDSYEKIEKRVKEVRDFYPNATYTNNHTGSKFTSDDQSMDYLIKALKKYNFIFVDSRTTSNSVVKKYTKKYDMPYIARNIFLDNNQDFNYIQKQLKKSIRIAKKTGSAIAIGHPYGITLKVLKESKHLLEGLNLVYLNEIPIH